MGRGLSKPAAHRPPSLLSSEDRFLYPRDQSRPATTRDRPPIRSERPPRRSGSRGRAFPSSGPAGSANDDRAASPPGAGGAAGRRGTGRRSCPLHGVDARTLPYEHPLVSHAAAQSRRRQQVERKPRLGLVGDALHRVCPGGRRAAADLDASHDVVERIALGHS